MYFFYKAARNNQIDAVKFLLTKGADKTIKNNENKTALDLGTFQFKIITFI
jgi:hypothetical protein